MQSKSLIDFLLIAIISATVGYGLGHYFTDRSEVDFSKNPDAVVAKDTISIEAANQLRSEGFRNFNTVADILSLPSLFSQKEALHTIAGRSNKVQLLLLIKESSGIANSKQRRNILQILVTRLTELDPATAIDISIKEFENRNYDLLPNVFSDLAKLDLDTAVDYANEIENRPQHNSAAEGVLSSINAEDVDLQLDLTKRLGLKQDRQLVVSNAIVEKAHNNPEAAMQEALLMPRSYDRETTMIRVMDSWAGDDPQQALAFVGQIGDKVMQQRLQETVLQRWAENDPEAAYSIMQTLPKSSTVNLSYTVFEKLANKNPTEAINLIEDIPSSRQRSDAYSAAISSWAIKDAQAAATYVAQLDNKQLRNQLAGIVIQQLSQESPTEALALAQEMDPNGQLYLQDTVIGQISATDPQRAFELAQTAQQETLRNQLSLTVINNIAYNNPVAAADLIDQMPFSDLTTDLVSTVAYGWVNSDPEAAFAWVNSKNGSNREEGLISLGSQLAISDPDLATRYLPQLSGKVREKWAENIAYHYASYDLNEAAAWIENYRGEAMYPTLLNSVATTAVGTDVELALQLAQNAPNQITRTNLIRQIADQISYNDPQRAELLYSGLPAETSAPEIASQ